MSERFNFVYDPTRQGFDTGLWKNLSGTVSAVDVIFPDTDPIEEGIQYMLDQLGISEGLTVTRT